MTPESAAGILFLAGAAVLGIVFLVIARSASRGPDPYEELTHRAYRFRRFWFLTVVVVLLAAFGLTLPHMPNPGVRQGRVGSPVLTATVVAQQWQWQVTPAVVEAGKPVRFEVSSLDVNHDFGIYNSQGRIVGQVQAMPGFKNVLYFVFPKGGTYTIRCLELCGLYHTAMVTELKVV